METVLYETSGMVKSKNLVETFECCVDYGTCRYRFFQSRQLSTNTTHNREGGVRLSNSATECSFSLGHNQELFHFKAES